MKKTATRKTVVARKTSAKKKTPRTRPGPAVAAAEPAMTGGGMFDTQQPTSGWGEGGQGYLSDDEDVGPPLDADDDEQ